MTRWGRFLLITAMAAGSSVTPALAARIGIDARYEGSPSSLLTGKYFDEFRASMLAASNTLVSVATFTTTHFDFLDALVLRQSLATNDLITATEVSDIHAFVNSGHGLLLLAEAGLQTDATVSNLNSIAAPFGVTFGVSPLHPEGVTLHEFYEHPVTVGVSSIGVDYYRPLVRISSPAIDLTRLSGENDFLAVVPGSNRRGNVVLIGDTSLWSDNDIPSDRTIDFGDNRLLLENTIAFVTVPSLAARQQGASVSLSWSSAMATLYHLQWSDNLSSGQWRPLTNQMQRIGTSNIVLDGISQARRYYRLQK
jgi:hypothetical protein